MIKISENGIIVVAKGDTFSVPLFINQGTELNPVRYVIERDDLVTFKLSLLNGFSETLVIEKNYSTSDLNEKGDIVVSFEHEDTNKLDIGTYYYEVKAYITIGESGEAQKTCTLIPKTKFIIIE